MLIPGEWVRFIPRNEAHLLVSELARLHAIAQVEGIGDDGTYVLTVFSCRGEPALAGVRLPEDLLACCTPPMWAS